jgi:GNAT superfamily N-acetyltransferase
VSDRTDPTARASKGGRRGPRRYGAAVEVRVEPVPAITTFQLRHDVLRPHETLDQLALPGDDDPDTCHLAARTVSGEVVGTASVRREPAPWGAGAAIAAWRLRGMATREDLRGHGIGTQVLRAVVAHVASRGGGLLWCNARVSAVSFYERSGFTTRGEPWVEREIVPHVAMWREVVPSLDRAT